MPKTLKSFKRPPERFQPKGIPILYEDHDILVVDKMNGLLTISNNKEKENTLYSRLIDYVRKGNSKSRTRIFIVHRLDKDTSGIIVFAKNEKAKRYLQDKWPNFSKKYYAVVHGMMTEKKGILTSYLTENSIHKMYTVTDPKKGKLAKTGYTVLKKSDNYSLLEIDLVTGRKNQIRVQFSDKGFPVAGDKIYGKKDKSIKRLALHAASLTLLHPYTKEKMIFKTKMPTYFESLVNR